VSEIRPRETVLLATSFAALVSWYTEVLGFRVTKKFDGDFHYCNMETPSGIEIGIASASEMGVTPTDRRCNTVILQFEVDELRGFFASVEAAGGTITDGPTFNERDEFWFGAFADPEGNPCWVVDKQCP
jgi:predicted enzyme related to lactoylglutathione lyase